MVKKKLTVEQYNKRINTIIQTISLIMVLFIAISRIARDCIEVSDFQILVSCLAFDLFISAVFGIVCRLFANIIYDCLKKENINEQHKNNVQENPKSN